MDQPAPHAATSLARRLSVPAGEPAWAPPPLPDLIARIDQALAARRGRPVA